MGKIQVLDCTLRDGGYANNWQFGKNDIQGLKKTLEETGVNIIEMGLIQNIEYNPNRTIYDGIERLTQVIGYPNIKTTYGALVEMSNYFPEERIAYHEGQKAKVLRYSFWKRLLDDAFLYGKQIINKGYDLSWQPTRIEQYDEKEFAELCKKFSDVNPYALYIVDTFGLLRDDDLLRYAQIAHENLNPNTILGYHVHDNMGQAFRNACLFVNQDYGNRTIQIDASIFGMGRGAGNLRLEQFLQYLNHKFDMNFNVSPIYAAWDNYLSNTMLKSPWGYNMAYYITAENACNPDYATFYLKKGLSIAQIERIISCIADSDKYLYSEEKAVEFMKNCL